MKPLNNSNSARKNFLTRFNLKANIIGGKNV